MLPQLQPLRPHVQRKVSQHSAQGRGRCGAGWEERLEGTTGVGPGRLGSLPPSENGGEFQVMGETSRHTDHTTVGGINAEVREAISESFLVH